MKAKSIKKYTRFFKHSRGFTLIELIVVMIAMGVLTVSVTPFIRTQIKAYINARNGKDFLQAARIGMSRMMAEMRLIQSPGDIDYGYSDEIQFDISYGNNITYSYSSNAQQLSRENEKLVIGVKSFLIEYFDEHGNKLSTPIIFSSVNNIRRIRVTMVVGNDNHEFVLREQVAPRSFYY